jgi:hypothetical protein
MTDTSRPATPTLDRVAGPADLKALSDSALRRLADEVRAEVISVVSQTSGHLGSSLWVVELTVAIHAVWRGQGWCKRAQRRGQGWCGLSGAAKGGVNGLSGAAKGGVNGLSARSASCRVSQASMVGRDAQPRAGLRRAAGHTCREPRASAGVRVPTCGRGG